MNRLHAIVIVTLGCFAVSSRYELSTPWIAGITSTWALFLIFINSGPQTKVEPNSPPIVGSWIPWLGKAIVFSRTPVEFFKICRAQYGTAYKFLAGGRYVVVLSSPTTIFNFLQNTAKTLDVVEFQMIGIITGITDRSRMPYLYSIVEHKALMAFAHGMSRRTYIQSAMSFNLDLQKRLLSHIGDKPEVTVSLLEFVQKSIFTSNSVALLGPHFDIDVYDDFMKFDEGIPMILRRIPILSRRGIRGRESVVAKLSEYILRRWRDEDGGYLEGASDVISDVVRELKAADMTHMEAMRLLNGFLWGSHSNHMRTTFWVMAYILTDKHVFRRIHAEIRIALAEKFSDINAFLNMDPGTLDGPDFNLLTSTVTEVLRLTALPGSFREVLQDTVIAGDDGESIFVQKGEFVTADVRGMHLDPTIYDDPETFKADRFLTEAGVYQYPNEKTFSVFGGGSHLCKGRYYAIHSIRVFVILCFHLFDITPVSVNGSTIGLPQADLTSLAPVIRTKEKLWVSLRRRQGVVVG
ncbi:hypothetical protein D9615_001586 [Tricholomella constricta]|uniref:Cytochrome P450 n=1 Tax=Tricholomella constricta TaxID=117010 RepID=A0A8H5MA75_9AGAR|nr:hypothetical protein D9615_001586 [Tricholomella constricta]